MHGQVSITKTDADCARFGPMCNVLPVVQEVVADDDLAALFGDEDSSDNEDYDPSAAPQVPPSVAQIVCVVCIGPGRCAPPQVQRRHQLPAARV